MIKEAIGVGATLEAAKEDAIAQLNARDDDDIQFEVLEQPRKKALGLFGSTPAKVRVFVELPDRKPQQNKAKKPAKKAVKEDKKATDKKEDKKETREKEAPDTNIWPEATTVDKLEKGSKAETACNYLLYILEGLGCKNVEFTVSARENGAKITIDGEDMGVAIGHKGETLDALQHLTSLSANAGKGGYFRVFLNIGDYRQKREKTLIALAQKVADQVKRTGRSRSLEPMNPYERRVIHTAIQEIAGVISASSGEGSARKVVVSIEKGRRAERVNSAPKSDLAPKKDSDIPLYGKIN